jgi:hypothetical protein
LSNNISYTKEYRHKRLDLLIKERIKQPGVEFPKPGQQEHLLIVRLNIVDQEHSRFTLELPEPRIDTT